MGGPRRRQPVGAFGSSLLVRDRRWTPAADDSRLYRTRFETGIFFYPFEAVDGWIMARNRVIDPLGDYKSDYEFWLDLGVKMGYGKDFWDGSIEKCMDYQLENFGMTMEELSARIGRPAIAASTPAGVGRALRRYDRERRAI